jgi:hypothetical protein
MLLGGQKGHLAMMDVLKLESVKEFQVCLVDLLEPYVVNSTPEAHTNIYFCFSTSCRLGEE